MTEAVVGVLRAGGKSSRMGGGDKCVAAGRQTDAAHVIERLSPQVSELILNANAIPTRSPSSVCRSWPTA